MNPLRDALLWASRSPSLASLAPRLWFVRRAVRQFMPGETLEDALRAARTFARRGLPTTLTHLGENVRSREEAEAATGHYLEVLRRVHRLGLDAEISVKLTHLGLDLDRALALENLERLARAAAELGNWVWVDMESSPYVDPTLDIYRKLVGSWPQLGVCLQAYLYRTEDDLETLLPLCPSVRLVKGAYREPPHVAHRRRARVDESFLRLARRLLEAGRAGRLRRFALATHDLRLVGRVERMRRELGLPREAFEVQMLYGIRQADQFRLVERGFRCRCLITYGEAWYPWYVRRLAERPANLWFVARNVFAPAPTALEALEGPEGLEDQRSLEGREGPEGREA
ncbi:MAG TPA: proline dehydrogenase family protein [Actinomycetota bacterium]|nr:proline dehydrogenase family protein [Actinomycetota bacterium]